MLYALAALIFGLLLLIWSADFFVSVAVRAARLTGVSPLVVGMVLVGFGTSAPELLVSAVSALEGNPGLALGNAYGSNMANIGLILGLAALLKPLGVQSGILRRELPVLLGSVLMSWVLLANGRISRLDAVLLMTAFFASMIWVVRSGQNQPDDPLIEYLPEPPDAGILPGWLWLSAQILAGLAGLVLSSRAFVWGAVGIAEALGVSDLLIGLTVVALGTSLPELAASLAAVRKGEDNLVLGNIIGSCLFNTLGVVGLAGVIHPLRLEPMILTRDFPVMTAMTLALFAVGVGFRGPGRVNRIEGACLLTVYLFYMVRLVSGA